MVRHLLLMAVIVGVALAPMSLQAQTAADADFDGSGKVDFADFSAFARAFGSAQDAYDLSGNGKVDFPDFSMFAVLFGQEVPSASDGRALTFALPSGVAMEFVRIEPGTFTMGTAEGQKLSLQAEKLWQDTFFEDELPVHQVTITEAFWLGKYEVTKGQWEAVMDTRPWAGRKSTDPRSPAVYVSWEAVKEFVEVLNSHAQTPLYRLATEAEWEYACRAGTETSWSCGYKESSLKDYAWYYDPANATEGRYVEVQVTMHSHDGNDGSFTRTEWRPSEYLGPREGQAVGTKRPNAWGLHDMHGNIAEWVQDAYSSAFYGSGLKIDPLRTGGSGMPRVTRGGFYDNKAAWVRSACREPADPWKGFPHIGFRLVREMNEP